ncbi:MAG: hypothetical protein HZA00_13590 [Nitrospinae bacterium]|nr:hypothetical protein [Nitrospinota bacterium]
MQLLPDISIDQKLKAASPNLTLGVVCSSVTVSKYDSSLWREIEHQSVKINSQINIEAISDILQFKELRSLYRSLGKDPTRYRGSAEALIRRVLQGKGLYKINTIVDINNLVSLETFHSVGSYNLAKLNPPITFRIGKLGESYKGIGKDNINIADLPVFADQLGPFGSPTSDSERAMVIPDTKQIMMMIISCTGLQNLSKQLHRVANLLSMYAHAPKEKIQIYVVD